MDYEAEQRNAEEKLLKISVKHCKSTVIINRFFHCTNKRKIKKMTRVFSDKALWDIRERKWESGKTVGSAQFCSYSYGILFLLKRQRLKRGQSLTCICIQYCLSNNDRV